MDNPETQSTLDITGRTKDIRGRTKRNQNNVCVFFSETTKNN